MSVVVFEHCPHCGEALPLEYRKISATPSFTYTTLDRGTPYKCPRCDGRGEFVMAHPPNGAASEYKQACMTCLGSGVLWSRDVLVRNTLWDKP